MSYEVIVVAVLCSLVDDYRCFEGTFCLHLHGRRISHVGKAVLQKWEDKDCG